MRIRRSSAVCRLVCLAASLIALPGARAGQDPHLGYIYPAGGQQGTVVDATVGGESLGGVNAALVTGSGVQATVVKYTRALSQGVLNDLQVKLSEAGTFETRRAAAIQDGDMALAGKLALLAAKANDEFETLAAKVGLDDPSPRGFAELRRRISDPRRQLNPQLAETVALRLTLSADATPGERELRLRTPSGMSNPLFLHVGQCREYREREPNDRTPDSDVLTANLADADFPDLEALPVILNGQVLPGDVDRFRFQIPKGTRLVAAVSARSLIPYLADAVPGWFQATLTLFDAKGNELAFSDDFRFHPDPLIYYETPASGEYILEIHDAIYRGREDFVYRITVGELPLITGIFPLGGPAGAKTTVKLEGWNLPADVLTLDAEKRGPGILPVSVSRGKRVSNAVPFALDTLPECLESEPNDEPSKAQSVTLPLIVNGRIGHPGDWDIFRLQGRAGDTVVAEVRARRLGSPLDSLLKLTDAAGKQLALSDDCEDPGAGLTTHHADSLLILRLPTDGTYLIHLGDTQHKGGTAYGYRLRISLARLDFALRVAPSCVNARPGTNFPITAHALRQDGFSGDIALSLKDAPQGFALSGATIPAGQDKVRLTMAIPPTPPGKQIALRLEGRAAIGGAEVCRMAVPAEDMMQAFAYRHLVPSTDGMVTVTGSRGAENPLRLLGEGPAKLLAGATARVCFSVPKGPLAKEIRLELDEPPKGIAVQEVSADEQGVAVLLSTDAKEAKPGLRGNLILNAFREFTPPAREGQPAPAKQRAALGMLPAIPFEIMAAPAVAAPAPKPAPK